MTDFVFSSASVSQNVSSTVSLCVVTLEIGLWFVLDVFVLDRYVRYIVTPYLVLVMALAGSITKNWDQTSSNSAFTGFLLALACLLTVFKLISLLARHRRLPLFKEISFFKYQKKDYGTLYNSLDGDDAAT